MWLMEDRARLEAYRAGEPAALEAVYRQYVERVTTALRSGFTFSSGGESYRFTGYRAAFELQEAVQETFARAFSASARAGYTGLRPFGPYITGIARNLVIDDFRRRRRELALFVPEDGSGPGTLDAAPADALEVSPIGAWTRARRSPEEALIERDTASAVASFVAELEGEHRRLLELHFEQRLSQQATAEAMGVDRNHVRRLIAEVRLKLLRHMKSQGRIGALDPGELLAALLMIFLFSLDMSVMWRQI